MLTQLNLEDVDPSFNDEMHVPHHMNIKSQLHPKVVEQQDEPPISNEYEIDETSLADSPLTAKLQRKYNENLED